MSQQLNTETNQEAFRPKCKTVIKRKEDLKFLKMQRDFFATRPAERQKKQAEAYGLSPDVMLTIYDQVIANKKVDIEFPKNKKR